MFIIVDKIVKKIGRIFRFNTIKILYGKQIILKKNIKIDLFKYLSFVIEDKNSTVEFNGNFVARNGFCIRLCNNATIQFGNNVFFNNYCSITSMKKITIGDNCIFGENVKIYDHNHIYKESSKTIVEQGFSSDTVSIGNNVWIGSNVVILKGVSIGNNSVIGAGSVVNKSVPENSLVLSNGQIRIIERI